jgi:pimeloyl-ACP methyl ester carboxylesterase
MNQEAIIFPGHAMQGTAETRVTPRADSELRPLTTSRGDRIYVEFGPALSPDGSHILSDAAQRPTFIFFYGNAMCLAGSVELCRDWRALGVNTLAVEYPGYGMSSGEPSEPAFYAAADAAYDYLARRGDVRMNKLISVGLSLGSGVAVDLASPRQVAGLNHFAPFNSIDPMARIAMPLLPVSLIVRHKFRNDQKIRDLKMPILIFHGRHDSIIPCQMSATLAAAATSADVERILFDADHNDLLEVGGPEMDNAMRRFIGRIDAGGAKFSGM